MAKINHGCSFQNGIYIHGVVGLILPVIIGFELSKMVKLLSLCVIHCKHAISQILLSSFMVFQSLQWCHDSSRILHTIGWCATDMSSFVGQHNGVVPVTSMRHCCYDCHLTQKIIEIKGPMYYHIICRSFWVNRKMCRDRRIINEPTDIWISTQNNNMQFIEGLCMVDVWPWWLTHKETLMPSCTFGAPFALSQSPTSWIFLF